jgi:hypothetical protein
MRNLRYRMMEIVTKINDFILYFGFSDFSVDIFYYNSKFLI